MRGENNGAESRVAEPVLRDLQVTLRAARLPSSPAAEVLPRRAPSPTSLPFSSPLTGQQLITGEGRYHSDSCSGNGRRPGGLAGENPLSNKGHTQLSSHLENFKSCNLPSARLSSLSELSTTKGPWRPGVWNAPRPPHLGHLPRVPISNQPQDSNKIQTVMSPPDKCEEFFPFEKQSSQQPGEQARLPVPRGRRARRLQQSKWRVRGHKAEPWWGRGSNTGLWGLCPGPLPLSSHKKSSRKPSPLCLPCQPRKRQRASENAKHSVPPET